MLGELTSLRRRRVMDSGLHQLLTLLPECLAVRYKPFGLLLQLVTGGAGAARKGTPEKIRLLDVPAALNQRMQRHRGKHRHPS
jgi:hypothetical protein